ncbi:MAG: hypothetical protein NW215_01045 [Hyphomicrobiales bacterium]|nr:hypothetical protein [Hyphomicrobiales bacterium]
MIPAQATLVQFLINCGCGDSNCSSCTMFFPKASCGDDSCSSCVCVIPVAQDEALVMLLQSGAAVALLLKAGVVVAASSITA